MKLVIISPEHDEPRETAVLGGLFSAGLERYHVRKPGWSREKLATWLEGLPCEWRPRLVLHQHHKLIAELGLGGAHWPDEVGRVVPNAPSQRLRTPDERRVKDNAPYLTSRSCHDFATLRAALGRYDTVLFGPVFPSLSKPGHGPRGDFSSDALSALLARRTAAERHTTVLALGGITAQTAPRAVELGFDGVAVLGGIWQAADPVRAFLELVSGCEGRDGRPARPKNSMHAASGNGRTTRLSDKFHTCRPERRPRGPRVPTFRSPAATDSTHAA